MRIDSILLPEDLKRYNLHGKTAVLIDVLRSSSCIVTALQNGCAKIVPSLNGKESFRLARHYPPESTILGGESGGYRIEGFSLGNSPLEYTTEVVKDKTIIFTSSNGIAALFALKGCKLILIASFLNLESVKDTALRLMGESDELLLVCAGNLGKISLEDALCAGMISRRISGESSMKPEKSAATLSTESLATIYQEKLPDVLVNCAWGRDLQRMGIGIAELHYCARLDSIPLVPYVTSEFTIKELRIVARVDSPAN